MARTTSPRTTQPGSPDQKWLHDYLVNVTGRPTNFDVAGRAFPASVKLQSATNLNATVTWTDVPGTSPLTVPITGSQVYYRGAPL